MKIYIISLVFDTKKRDKISKKLNSLNLNYEFIDAVYGKKLDPLVFENLNNSGYILNRGFNPTPGEVGCTLSHSLAMKKIIETNEVWGCILEDDAILDERFKYFIEDFSQKESNNIYILGGQDGLFPQKFIAKSFFNFEVIGSQKLSKVISSDKYVNRTCCYVIGRKSAKKYLEVLSKSFFLADDWVFLKKNEVYKNIYLGGFVGHPLDLSDSNIELERINGEKTQEKTNTFFYNFLRKNYHLLKYLFVNLKRFMV